VLETAKSFWKLGSKVKFSKVKDFALKMHLMFGNTYVCESTFSTMKQVKSKNRNWMADKTMDDSLRLATINTGIHTYRSDSVREASTEKTAIGCCAIISMPHSLILTFLVLNVANLLFYTPFYWKWPASFHVFVKWPPGQKQLDNTALCKCDEKLAPPPLLPFCKNRERTSPVIPPLSGVPGNNWSTQL